MPTVIAAPSLVKPPAPTVETLGPSGWVARSNVTIPARDDVAGFVTDGVGSIAHQIGRLNIEAEQFVLEGPSLAYAVPPQATKKASVIATIKSCVREGARIGAGAGVFLTVVPDFIFGNGSTKVSQYDPKSEGVVGVVAHAALEAAGEVAMLPGALCGIVTGSIAAPFSREPSALLRSHMNIGMEAVRATVSAVAGLAVGLGMASVRAPSLIVKGVSMAIGGFIGSIVGIAKSIGILLRK